MPSVRLSWISSLFIAKNDYGIGMTCSLLGDEGTRGPPGAAGLTGEALYIVS
uniref:Uncharacterized protein n=1 Tax=Parascaris equorum TaxID=6256 RepID=A0A914RWS0_PAREQ